MTLSREQIPVRCTLMRGGTSKAVFMRMTAYIRRSPLEG